MPLPTLGQTDLQLVKSAFNEIRAQGVDVERDVIKAVRLGDLTNGKLGTILVEMRNQESKAQIMKTKKCLENHPNQGLQKLIIKNAQTKSEIKTNIALNEMLRKIPGEQNSYIAGNGHIMSKDHPHRQQHNRVPHQHGHQNQGYQRQPQHSYPGYQYQNHPFFPSPYANMPAANQSQATPQPNPFAQFYSTHTPNIRPPAPTYTSDQPQHSGSSAPVAGQENAAQAPDAADIPVIVPVTDSVTDQVESDIQVQADVHEPPQ